MSIGLVELVIILLGLLIGVVPVVGGILGILAFRKVNQIERELRERRVL